MVGLGVTDYDDAHDPVVTDDDEAVRPEAGVEAVEEGGYAAGPGEWGEVIHETGYDKVSVVVMI